jgi:HK97 family phage portal protein
VGILRQSLGLETLGTTAAGKRLAKGIPSRNDRSIRLDTVVGLPAVFRSYQLLSTLGAGVPFASWRGTELATRQPTVVRKPDPWRERNEWSERVITDLAADGNAFFRLGQNPLNDLRDVVSAEALNPFAVHVRRDKSGRKVYDHRTAGTTETLSAEQVHHVWLNQFPGFNRGLSPITACRLSFAGAMDTRDYASKFFDTGAIPPGVLTSDGNIDDVTAKAAQDRWHDGDSSRIKVLGRNLKFEPILIKPEDAQWIEAQRFNVLDVARIFGIPPVLLAAAIEGSSLTYQNLQDVQEHLLVTTLRPVYLDKIAAALTGLIANGQEVRHDYSDLLRRDDKTRMETHEIAIRAGVYDATEARRREGIAGPAPAKPAAQEVPA